VHFPAKAGPLIQVHQKEGFLLFSRPVGRENIFYFDIVLYSMKKEMSTGHVDSMLLT